MDEKRKIALAYLANFGDIKPTDCSAGIRESFPCPMCKGSGIKKDVTVTEYTCQVCNGVGYFDHRPKPKMVQVGWE